jgi:FtsH-binding integral membrane protein
MSPLGELLQHNPMLVVLVLVGFPSLTWAAAYARRPSRARRRMAIGAFVAMLALTLVAVVEALRGGAPWWPPLVCGGVIAALWATAILFRRG